LQKNAALPQARFHQLVRQIQHIEHAVGSNLDGMGADPDPGAGKGPGLHRHVLGNRLVEICLQPIRPGLVGAIAVKRVEDLARNVIEAAHTAGRIFRQRRHGRP
jgi:hypothetical protein